MMASEMADEDSTPGDRPLGETSVRAASPGRHQRVSIRGLAATLARVSSRRTAGVSARLTNSASCPAPTRFPPVNTPLIRLATVDDVPLLCRLGAATFRETYRAISDPREVDEYADEHFTPGKVAAWFHKPCARTLLAVAGETPVGYAHLRHARVPACVADRKAIELSRLYLLGTAQGSGLGSAMMAAALAQAAQLEARTVWLGAYDRNVRALGFYARHGFTPVGTHEFEFGGRIYADPVLTRPVVSAP